MSAVKLSRELMLRTEAVLVNDQLVGFLDRNADRKWTFARKIDYAGPEDLVLARVGGQDSRTAWMAEAQKALDAAFPPSRYAQAEPPYLGAVGGVEQCGAP